jgi:environmental stress-induced protein Ves
MTPPRILPIEGAAVVPWKNGHGTTREVISAGDPFAWRLSFATLAGDAPFSRFDGIDRLAVLVAGGPVSLIVDGEERSASIGEVTAFRGESEVFARLSGEPGLILNLMTRRGVADGTLTVTRHHGERDLAHVDALVLLSGEMTVGGVVVPILGTVLPSSDGLVVSCADATVAEITIWAAG